MYCNELHDFRLLGRVALVTGGASGIGESIVRLFHKHGAKVCIADIQDNLSQRICESLGNGPDLSFCHCDGTTEDDVRQSVDFTVDKFDLRCKRERRFRRNETCGSYNDPGKEAAKKGSIISICSVASAVGGLGPHAYTGSKHAVLGLTKSVAAELGKHGIRVNCVSPFAVATGLALAHLPEDERTEDALIGFHNFVGSHANLKGVDLTADDVANAVLFLASDEARYVSGANLMVDGGFTSSNHSLRVFR
ncbi:hypothetical protein DH2020_007650 [Rehmannia glutinosa]|uniref:Uncharacterized protein n=1 Tax=Rehmannia glutinosa TaxID=99300 RepID=A0ABR0TZ97_REHGL